MYINSAIEANLVERISIEKWTKVVVGDDYDEKLKLHKLEMLSDNQQIE